MIRFYACRECGTVRRMLVPEHTLFYVGAETSGRTHKERYWLVNIECRVCHSVGDIWDHVPLLVK